MSQYSVKNYDCPYCGNAFQTNVYYSVDAEDIDLRDRCVSGEVFKCTCPSCHKEFYVQNDLTYIDRTNKFVLVLSDTEVPSQVFELGATLAKNGYRLRRCETIGEFVEKIQIFEDGIDDVMVELARYDCFIEFVDNDKGTAEDITSIDYQRCEAGVMKINVRTEDKGLAFTIPTSVMEEEMEQNKERYAVDNATFPVVNAAWIISLFQDLTKEEA